MMLRVETYEGADWPRVPLTLSRIWPYGVAWDENVWRAYPDTVKVIWYPIPFNWLAAWCHYWLLRRRSSGWLRTAIILEEFRQTMLERESDRLHEEISRLQWKLYRLQILDQIAEGFECY